MNPTADTLKQRARELGFALCGIAEARPSDHAAELHAWLAAGKHGDMTWLATNIETRIDPDRLLPGAKSVISVADYFGPGDRADSETHTARYVDFDDYHKVMKKRLHQWCDELSRDRPEHQFRACVDTAPMLEREFAMRAGLGWVGKNTLLIHPRLGSHLMLGEIVTTLDLPADACEGDHCGTCTRCIDACPTDCITPYSVDASRCISYLTIEHRSAIDPALHEAIGDWLYGCDICQDVCPFNKRLDQAPVHESYGVPRAAIDASDVLHWREEDRRAVFTRSAMKRAKLDQMKRNALIVITNRPPGNHVAALEARLQSIADDANEAPLVRETARQCFFRLTAPRNPAQ
ncbi:MAG: tRNA epoxyqueuosine(34) reductase QueG [Planctomycetes bacterium]|nr:tRNA epoxyqueuosine(34) reductase QueG [Planctomycetota bacterium]